MEFIHILESHFHGYAFAFTVKICDVTHRFLGFIQVLDKANNPIRFMEFNGFRGISSLYLQKRWSAADSDMRFH